MYTRYIDKKLHHISYICFDSGLPKIVNSPTEVIYIPVSNNKFLRYLKFNYVVSKCLHKKKYDLVFHVYGRFTLLLRLMNLKRKFILDIRTGSLSENRIKRTIKNYKISGTSLFYRRVSIISESLRKKLGVRKSKTIILPLGGEKLTNTVKKFDVIKMIYIGTLDKRNIHETIEGLAHYIKKNKNHDINSYDIIGFGKQPTIRKIKETISKNNLEEIVKFHGRMIYNKLKPFLMNSNCGIVYIPQTKYYETQPSTKLFEYILSGIPVIATNTYENRVHLIDECGIISEDNPVDFSNAIDRFVKKTPSFDTEQIKNLYKLNEWQNITKHILEPFIESCI